MKQNLYEQLADMASHINIDTSQNLLVNQIEASKKITEIARKFIHPYSKANVYNQKEENLYIILGIDEIQFVKFHFNINNRTLQNINPLNIRIPLDWIRLNTEISYLLGNTIDIYNYEYDLNLLKEIVKNYYKNIYYKGISSLLKIRATTDDIDWLNRNIESFLELMERIDDIYLPENIISSNTQMQAEFEKLYETKDIYIIDINIRAAKKEYNWKKEFLTFEMSNEYINKCVDEFYSQPHSPACGNANVSISIENYFDKELNRCFRYILKY